MNTMECSRYVAESIMWHSAREAALEENRAPTECHIILFATGLGEMPSVLFLDACGFRGKAVTIPKLIRSAFRN